jgi:Mg-chelatase subunit ChlD
MFGRNRTTATTAPARSVSLVKDPAGAPAVDLDTITGHVDLTKRAQKAGISLSKRNLAGIRAQAVLILDHSGSMRDDYRTGVVQTLVERALGFALQIDVDGTIPVIAFDTVVHPAVDVGVHNYAGVVDRDLWRRDRMGRTNLADALTELRDMAATTDAPIFAVVVTDGAPDSRPGRHPGRVRARRIPGVPEVPGHQAGRLSAGAGRPGCV